jgi:hypothetical protein
MPAPPPASYVASVACLVVGGAVATSGRSITLDGETLQVREGHIPAITPTGAGPLDLYAQLARMLAGASPPPRVAASAPADMAPGNTADSTAPGDTTGNTAPGDTAPGDATSARQIVEPLVIDAATVADFPLAALEPLTAHDPFTSPDVRAQLVNPTLVEVYPFDRHLHAFVEAFRRMYFAQRGRL